MALGAYIVNHDLVFNQLTKAPIIINNYDITSEVDKQELNDQLRYEYSNDLLSIEPRCNCGHTHGGVKRGKICPKCQEPVLPITEVAIESRLWMAAPAGVEGFINPTVWTIFFKRIKAAQFQPLMWCADVGYKPARNINYDNNEAYITLREFLKHHHAPRGISSTIKYFPEIIQLLFRLKVVRDSVPVTVLTELWMFYEKYKDGFFPKHLPVPSKIGFIVENTPTGRYADQDMQKARDAVLTICESTSVIYSDRDRARNERLAVKAVKQLAEYYDKQDRTLFSQKKGLIRKNIAGSKQHYTFRSVITSLTGVHDMNELKVPYPLMVPLLKQMIIKKLFDYGFSATDALRKTLLGVKKIDPDIQRAMLEIIDETLHKRIYTFLARNPTLKWLSNRRFFIREIIMDASDTAIRLSTLSISPSNADFDGDELNGTLILDEVMMKASEAFTSKNCVLDLNVPLTIAGDVALPATLIASLNRWMYSND